jgi:hypothetical protein
VAGRHTALRTFGRDLGDAKLDFGLAGGAYLFGHLAGSPTIRDIGLHTLETLAVVDLTVTVFKVGVGRARPLITSRSDDLDPLSFDHAHNSFPSGHTAQAFALATTLSAELHDRAPWVPFVAYPLATWTATTRVLDHEHWYGVQHQDALILPNGRRPVGRLTSVSRGGSVELPKGPGTRPPATGGHDMTDHPKLPILAATAAFLLVTGSATPLAAQETPQTEGSPLAVAEAVIATGLQDLQPADSVTSVAADVGQVYCWTRVTGAEGEVQIEHVWYHGDQEVARVPLRVASADWRTFSSKRIAPEWTGQWRVDVVGPDGTVLDSVGFSVQ